MTKKEIDQTIEALRLDDNYYGELGSRFLSNSDIVNLVNNPTLYGQGLPPNPALLQGDYMHKRILQPELVKGFNVVDAPSRRDKKYKAFVEDFPTKQGDLKPVFLLKHEVETLESLAMKIESNDEFVDALQTDVQPNEIEEPMVGQIGEYWFKGKADRINKRRGFIADLKTTRSLSSFRSNFRTYGYHSQAYIYQKLFGLPVRFYVISKEDGRLLIVDVTDTTLSDAEAYVSWGLEKMEMYYGSGTQAIEQHYNYLEL